MAREASTSLVSSKSCSPAETHWPMAEQVCVPKGVRINQHFFEHFVQCNLIWEKILSWPWLSKTSPKWSVVEIDQWDMIVRASSSLTADDGDWRKDPVLRLSFDREYSRPLLVPLYFHERPKQNTSVATLCGNPCRKQTGISLNPSWTRGSPFPTHASITCPNCDVPSCSLLGSLIMRVMDSMHGCDEVHDGANMTSSSKIRNQK